MKKSTTASIEFAVEWQNQNVKHCDRYHFDRIDFWLDIFPGRLGETLSGQPIDTVVIKDTEKEMIKINFVAAANKHKVLGIYGQRIK